MASAFCAEDIEPSEAEHIVDFTCQSPWERFALNVELTFRDWKISDGRCPDSSASFASNEAEKLLPVQGMEADRRIVQSISLANRKLYLELRSEDVDRSLTAEPLQRLLGIRQCILLRAENSDGAVAHDNSDATSLLSAMTVAASACGCTLPLIVPVGRPSSCRLIGRQVGPVRMSRFCCDFLTFLPDNFSHLSGLLDLFSSKRSSARRVTVPKTKGTTISAKFIYDWTDFSFKISPQPNSFAADRRLAAVQEEALAEHDPIRCIQLSCFWDAFNAEKLTPAGAAMPVSTAARVRLRPTATLLESLPAQKIPSGRIPLTRGVRACLRLAVTAANRLEFTAPGAPLPLLDTTRTLEAKYVPSIVSISDGPKQGFHGDTESAERRHSIRAGTARIPLPSSLEDFLTQAKQFLAVAAMEDKTLDDEYLSSSIAALFDSSTGAVMSDVVEALGPTLAELTLTERLGKLMGSLRSMNAVKYLWSLFLDGVEIHWEQRWMIAGVYFNPGQGPFLYDNLIVQKLQMINCCVDREHVMKMEAAEKADDTMGRKRKLDNVNLVDRPEGSENGAMDVEVWEPHVQPIPLVTRDLVEAEQNRLITGVDDDQRNGDESKTLTSDMKAFKAANPNATMTDFVRWFSPADWIVVDDEETLEDDEDESEAAKNSSEGTEDTEKTSTAAPLTNTGEMKDTAVDPTAVDTNGLNRHGCRRRLSGQLSARMRKPGNEWESLWRAADPVPAHRQPALFDPSAHGRQALNDLRNMPLAQVLLQLCAVVGASGSHLLATAFEKPPSLPDTQSAIASAKKAFRDANASLPLHIGARAAFEADARRVADASDALAVAEHGALCAASLLRKLPPTGGFAAAAGALARGGECAVADVRDREVLAQVAGLAEAGWRAPLLPRCREFLLEEGGGEGDRMYAMLAEEEFQAAFRLGIDYGG